MSDQLSDELLAVAAADGHFPYPGSGAVLRRAAREVLASRKLIADLRALQPKGTRGSLHYGGSNQALLAVRRMIEEAGL